jgi:hypothetical protein
VGSNGQGEGHKPLLAQVAKWKSDPSLERGHAAAASVAVAEADIPSGLQSPCDFHLVALVSSQLGCRQSVAASVGPLTGL